MIAKHVSGSDLHAALAKVNEKYDGNVEFKRIEDRSGSRSSRFLFTLRVSSSKGKGASRNPVSSRRSCAACWHVHGDFFQALLEIEQHAVIVTGLRGKRVIDRDGGNWQDVRLGNLYQPYMMSDACECAGEW